MASGYADWTRAIRLLGIDADGKPVTILADSTGRLYSLVTGEDAAGVLRAVRVDDDGRVIMVPRGQSGNYMLVDASGFLSAILKGEKADTSLVNVAVDDDGQMIMVPRGQSGHYMAIDSDGYMTAVLKGAYGAALRTIGLDDQGRITAYMVDDESQWGDVVKCGNAELAARLGSQISYDWRGKIVLVTDFARGLGGIYTRSIGTGGKVFLDPTKHLSGGYSVKMVGGSAWEYIASLYIGLDIPPTTRAGFCIRWTSDTALVYLEIQLHIYDGTTHHRGAIRISVNDLELQYQDSAGDWQKLDDFTPVLSGYAWQSLKLVIDTTTDTYIRALIGNTEHDMSAIAIYTNASATAPHIEAWVRLHSESGSNRYAWIDSLALTVAEPA